MISHSITDEYFEWLYDTVCGESFGNNISYRKLLMRLHNIDFRYSIRNDKNRALDGIGLRNRFASAVYGNRDIIIDNLDGPCSVLEMMTALAIRCEVEIMDDPSRGDRTRQWFWGMVRSLGLLTMSDERFDRNNVDKTINTFLDREYSPNGKGGLFTVKNCKDDMRDVEIWWQMCWYLDTIA